MYLEMHQNSHTVQLPTYASLLKTVIMKHHVISKSKLAPLKTVTLPRLELSAAVTAVRLYRSMIHEIDLPVERTYFWTDSTLTHQYISNTKHRFKVYPAN